MFVYSWTMTDNDAEFRYAIIDIYNSLTGFGNIVFILPIIIIIESAISIFLLFNGVNPLLFIIISSVIYVFIWIFSLIKYLISMKSLKPIVKKYFDLNNQKEFDYMIKYLKTCPVCNKNIIDSKSTIKCIYCGTDFRYFLPNDGNKMDNPYFIGEDMNNNKKKNNRTLKNDEIIYKLKISHLNKKNQHRKKNTDQEEFTICPTCHLKLTKIDDIYYCNKCKFKY